MPCLLRKSGEKYIFWSNYYACKIVSNVMLKAKLQVIPNLKILDGFMGPKSPEIMNPPLL